MATSSADVALLLRRAGFGGTSAQIGNLAALGTRADVVEVVLSTSPAYAGSALPTLGPSSGLDDWQQFTALIQWWIDRMARTTTPIVEKMTMFWHGLFTTSFSKVFDPQLIAAQHQFYRANALGDLRSLVHGMTLQPAMLDYLDNAWSNKWAPNQNFARELMELFLLGVGNYTEDDVDAAAAAFTGHGFEPSSGAYLFRPEWHDNSTKTFLGHQGNLDGPDIVDIILTDPTVSWVMARWIAKKLWEFFAHPAPPPGVVDAIASSLLAGYDIVDALRTLFNLDEFYLPASVNGHVRSPIEYMVAVLRGLPNTNAVHVHPEWFLEDMGQMPFNPPTVEGWKHNGYWVSTATAGTKARFAYNSTWALDALGHHPFANSTQLSVPGAAQLAFDTLHITSPTGASRGVLESWLQANRAAQHHWFERHGLWMAALLCPELQIG